ncbi:FeoA family protein [Erythrobacter sp. HKB08]|uniref:FeoA family protein n=1 Tax=Erythrobacter sp. HKB08 TaxID=2502843 RepID=UPI001008CC5F|nr:FeoA family protein [Erythrobacter sp. HKB08]
MTLDGIKLGSRVRIIAVDWDSIAIEDAKRLRALGIDDGAEIALAHRGVFGTRDPLAVSIGRTTIAIRRSHAQAMTVEVQ